MLSNLLQKLHNRTVLFLTLLLLIYLVPHFLGLHTQEFNGDEAAPMLLIDRMLDAFRLHDPRFLAYPFLFYSDPFRASISGFMLHFIGPHRVLLRIPSIIEGVLTLACMFHILRKNGLNTVLTTLVVSAYAFSGVIINNRAAGGDSFMRLVFLIAVYTLTIATKTSRTTLYVRTVVLWSIAFFTMLNAVVLVPLLACIGVQLRVYKDKKTFLTLLGIGILLAGYLALWLYLPYRAYLSGFQEHYINRGLFYYFTRASEGIATAPFNPFDALLHYTSPLFTAWLLWAGVYQMRIKQFGVWRWTHFFIWLFVCGLSHTSFHVIMFLPVLTIHAALMTKVFLDRNKGWERVVLAGFLVVICMNLWTLGTTYGRAFSMPTTCLTADKNLQLDESVQRMYASHNTTPLYQPCGNVIIQ